MLTLTETASTVVKTIVDRDSGAEDAGLRINTESEGGSEFSVTIAPAEPTDAVVEKDGAKVFLGENAVAALDDKVLDAEVHEDGSVRFALSNQA